jgi:succinate-acetate transporter protein
VRFPYDQILSSNLSISSGLFSFASTTLVLSLYNVNARHIAVPNVIVGMALFFGGLAQFLAGMWEFATGNTFGATGESTTPLLSSSHSRVMVVMGITEMEPEFHACVKLVLRTPKAPHYYKSRCR